jgi:hypothetical protein
LKSSLRINNKWLPSGARAFGMAKGKTNKCIQPACPSLKS